MTYSGWLTHISGHPSATSRAQDSESTSANALPLDHATNVEAYGRGMSASGRQRRDGQSFSASVPSPLRCPPLTDILGRKPRRTQRSLAVETNNALRTVDEVWYVCMHVCRDMFAYSLNGHGGAMIYRMLYKTFQSLVERRAESVTSMNHGLSVAVSSI